MKITQTAALRPAGGRVSRFSSAKSNGGMEHAEIKMYLSKLKNLVPLVPKDRKVSTLEVIHYVIAYIADLQSSLKPLDTAAAFLEHRRRMEIDFQQHDDVEHDDGDDEEEEEEEEEEEVVEEEAEPMDIDPLAERLAAEDVEDQKDAAKSTTTTPPTMSSCAAARQPLADLQSPLNSIASPPVHAEGALTATTNTATSTFAVSDATMASISSSSSSSSSTNTASAISASFSATSSKLQSRVEIRNEEKKQDLESKDLPIVKDVDEEEEEEEKKSQ